MKKTLREIARHIRDAGYWFAQKFQRIIFRLKNRTRHASRSAVPKSRVMGQSVSIRSGKLARMLALWKQRGVRIAVIAGGGVLVAGIVLTIALASRGGAQAAQAAPADSPAAATMSASTAPTTAQQATTAVEATPVPTTAPEAVELLPGCHDERIITVQERLMDLGYLGSDEPTDYYGWGTEYALQLFQRKHSLQVDGILGDNTMTALFAGDAMPYTVKLGDTGTDVSTIQERLKELKYFSGEVTGDFGDRTETAVKNFQKRNGLSPDGNVGESTREILFSDDARPASGSGGSSGGSGGSGGSGSTGSHGGGTTIATWEPDSAKVEALISFAQTLLGKKYVTGGKGPNVFDCSGFVYYCLNQSGYSIGYMTSSGWARCSLPKVTNMSDMRRGDIICFKGHVGIYLGGGQMIDASSTQGKVRISTTVLTSSYWKRNFICARRLF